MITEIARGSSVFIENAKRLICGAAVRCDSGWVRVALSAPTGFEIAKCACIKFVAAVDMTSAADTLSSLTIAEHIGQLTLTVSVRLTTLLQLIDLAIAVIVEAIASFGEEGCPDSFHLVVHAHRWGL